MARPASHLHSNYQNTIEQAENLNLVAQAKTQQMRSCAQGALEAMSRCCWSLKAYFKPHETCSLNSTAKLSVAYKTILGHLQEPKCTLQTCRIF